MAKNKLRPKPQVMYEPEPEPELVSIFEGKPLPEERPKKHKPSKDEIAKKERKRRKRAKFLSALDGSVLFEGRMQDAWGQVLFAFVMVLLMISGNYRSEAVIRESSVIKGELQDLHFRQISSKEELMRISRQSSVARMLDTTGVKESLVPPYIIKYEGSQKNRKRK